MTFLKSPDSLTRPVFTNRPTLYHIRELYAAACEGIVLKEQERTWKDEIVANFKPFKKDGKYHLLYHFNPLPFAYRRVCMFCRILQITPVFPYGSFTDCSLLRNRRLLWSINWRYVYNFWWISISKYYQLQNKHFFSRTMIYYPVHSNNISYLLLHSVCSLQMEWLAKITKDSGTSRNEALRGSEIIQRRSESQQVWRSTN
jgi:hypothetical protein